MEESKVAVVMVPLPCQSHLNQMLHLAAAISTRGLPVHYVGAAIHNRQVRLRAAADTAAGIKFHDFSLDSSPVPHPIIAFKQHRVPITDLVRELSTCTRKTVVVYDRFLADVVEDAVSIPGVVSYAFHCSSVFNYYQVQLELTGKKALNAEEKLPRLRDIYDEGFFYCMSITPKHFEDRDGDIYNTCRAVEGRYLDLLATGGKMQFAIWPSGLPTNRRNSKHDCIKWLDRQPPRSVIYVSFGSSTSLTRQQTEELAAGLEGSGKRFIWAAREADKEDIFAGEGEKKVELPEGFEERVGERGVVVRDWAPQMEILSHEATGGFMTHCGWNSCFESLICGVPVAAWPMNTDQPMNAYLLTEVLRVGVVVREWEPGEKVVAAAEIKSAVERLLSAEEGGEVRKRAEEMSAAVKKSIEEGAEIDDFISDIKG